MYGKKALVADENHGYFLCKAGIAQALGILPWIDEVTGKYNIKDFANNRLKHIGETDVDFEVAEQTLAPSGVVKPLISLSDHSPDNPKHTHFTLSAV